MTTLHERIDLDSAPDEPDVAGIESPPRDIGARRDDTVARAPRRSLFAWVKSAWAGVREAAKPPPPVASARRHYPPRFSLEFQTSLVDRERRRL